MSPKTAAWLERVRRLAEQTYPLIKGLYNEIEDPAGRRRDIFHSLSDLHTLIMSPGAKAGLGRNEMRAVKKLFALGATAARLAGLRFEAPNVAKKRQTLLVTDTRHLDDFIESIDPEEFKDVVDLLGTIPLSHASGASVGDRPAHAPRPNSKRDKLVFDRYERGDALKDIRAAANKNKDWVPIGDSAHVRKIYVRYCGHIGKTPSSRK